MAESQRLPITIESLPEILKSDTKVKVAGVDADGVLRGKLMSKTKFLNIAEKGFGFCSVIFGWDMHDKPYSNELSVSNAENGYRDLLAYPDLSSFRRVPWENNIPFFLLSFVIPETGRPVSVCPRGLLKSTVDKLKASNLTVMAGVEYEFSQFKVPSKISSNNTMEKNDSIATFLRNNPVSSLPPLTEGMFGYSLTRPLHNKDYFYEIFDICQKFNCGIEGWHTESGPGVFEAALSFGEIQEIADKASLFKFAVKSIATQYGITPCFMAKPRQGLPGNSGHIHISIVDNNGKNIFTRERPDENAAFSDLRNVSDKGRQFLAGLLEGLPDIMPLLAPTINSYKRLVENFWAPITVSWGLENRVASIRLIAPPTSKPEATRFEIRVPGADTNPFYVLAAILALGWRGIQKELEVKQPPLSKSQNPIGNPNSNIRLARSLKEATEIFMRKESLAREVLGDEFVEHFGGTRLHEIRLWDEAVTDWEVQRFIETI
ncbi:Type-1 glutamine synthetase 2 [Podosphaera aphanis]|nr:Type-1 glutamine synthetase 2 [Podosphaera aphanis]